MAWIRGWKRPDDPAPPDAVSDLRRPPPPPLPGGWTWWSYLQRAAAIEGGEEGGVDVNDVSMNVIEVRAGKRDITAAGGSWKKYTLWSYILFAVH